MNEGILTKTIAKHKISKRKNVVPFDVHIHILCSWMHIFFSRIQHKSFFVRLDNNRQTFLGVNILYRILTPLSIFFTSVLKRLNFFWERFFFFYLLIRLSYFPACLIFYLIIAHVLCMSRHSGNNLHINQARLSFNPFLLLLQLLSSFLSFLVKKNMKEDCRWDYILFFSWRIKTRSIRAINPFLRSIHLFSKNLNTKIMLQFHVVQTRVEIACSTLQIHFISCSRAKIGVSSCSRSTFYKSMMMHG